MDKVGILNRAFWLMYHFVITVVIVILLTVGAASNAPLWFMVIGLLLGILSGVFVWANYSLIKTALLETPVDKTSKSEPED